MKTIFLITSLTVSLALAGGKKVENPKVLLETSEGNIVLELNKEKAPKSVENFLKYVDDKFYDGTIFHRVIDNFMIQGGGFDEQLRQKDTRGTIVNEATNGLKNDRGTIAMARLPEPDSATAQFFINLKDNDFLNHKSKKPTEFGYAVFGKVTEGLDVVDKIKKVATHMRNGMGDVPVMNIVIKKVKKL